MAELPEHDIIDGKKYVFNLSNKLSNNKLSSIFIFILLLTIFITY